MYSLNQHTFWKEGIKLKNQSLSWQLGHCKVSVLREERLSLVTDVNQEKLLILWSTCTFTSIVLAVGSVYFAANISTQDLSDDFNSPVKYGENIKVYVAMLNGYGDVSDKKLQRSPAGFTVIKSTWRICYLLTQII